MEMAQYIMHILKSQLMVVFSWGFHNARAVENGLAFDVQADSGPKGLTAGTLGAVKVAEFGNND